MLFRQLYDPQSSTYTYLLGCQSNNEAVLIDPVYEQFSRDAALIRELGLHVRYVIDTHVHVGPTEYRLLELLMRHPDRAFDRSQLLDRVWGRSVYVEERTVDVHVLRLRKVLQPFKLQHLIQTVRGVGYRFSPQ